MLLTAFLPLIQPRATTPEREPTTMGWAFPTIINHYEKCLIPGTYGSIFSTEVSSFQIILVWQLDRRTASIAYKYM